MTQRDCKTLSRQQWNQFGGPVSSSLEGPLRFLYSSRSKPFPFIMRLIWPQMEQLKKLVAKQKKKFWAEIGAAMSRSGLGCEKAAKKAKLAMY